MLHGISRITLIIDYAGNWILAWVILVCPKMADLKLLILQKSFGVTCANLQVEFQNS